MRIKEKDFLILNKKPLIAIKRNFLLDEECDSLCSAAKEQGLNSSTVLVENSNVHNTYRVSSDCYLRYNEGINGEIRKKLSKLVSHPIKYFENTTVIKYEKEQYYKPHYDFFYDHQIQVRRQRVATAICYLNTPIGGETTFPKLNIVHKPQKGDLLFFRYDYDKEINPLTMHEGVPPTEGEKWIATIWMQEKLKLFDSIKWLYK